MLLRILISTANPRRAEQLAELLDGEELLIRTLARQDNLWEALRAGSVDLLIADEETFEGSLPSAIQSVRALPEAPEVVVLTSNADPSHRAGLLAAEVFATLDPTVTRDELIAALQALAERRKVHAEQQLAQAQLKPDGRLSDFATASPAMREFLSVVRRVADTSSTLLITGETGVGKEYLSRAIHAESSRRDAPFVAVNCSALSPTLLESELFGHVEGAFTGAQRARRGYFELAHQGTLFVDEVGELSPQLQVKLLRVLQDRVIQPVGSEEEFDIDVRIIAATNRNLGAEIDANRFRADLFYRISVVQLEIPPLRRRREDIPALIESHVENFRIAMNRPVESIGEDALELLVQYRWPGNVRELINIVERAMLLCEGTQIAPQDLPEEVRLMPLPAATAEHTTRPSEEPAGPAADPLEKTYHDARREMLDAFESGYVQALLKRANGRVRDASRIADLNPRSLYEKMKKHGIRKEFYKL